MMSGIENLYSALDKKDDCFKKNETNEELHYSAEELKEEAAGVAESQQVKVVTEVVTACRT